MFKAVMKILLKQYYKRNPEICAWCIPVNENIDIHYIVEKSYLDRHEFGTKIEYYDGERKENGEIH